MSDIRIAQSWDSIPPVLYDGDEPISTRKLEKDYRDAVTKLEQLEKDLTGCIKLIASQETEINRLSK